MIGGCSGGLKRTNLLTAGAGPLRVGRPVTQGHCPPHSKATAAKTGSYPQTGVLWRPSGSAYFGLRLKLSICLTFFSQVPISRPFCLFFLFRSPPLRTFRWQDLLVQKPERSSQSSRGWTREAVISAVESPVALRRKAQSNKPEQPGRQKQQDSESSRELLAFSLPLGGAPSARSTPSTALDWQGGPPNPSAAQTAVASVEGETEPIGLGREGVSCPRGSAHGLATIRRCSPALSTRAPRPSPQSYAAAERRPRAVTAIAAAAAASRCPPQVSWGHPGSAEGRWDGCAGRQTHRTAFPCSGNPQSLLLATVLPLPRRS